MTFKHNSDYLALLDESQHLFDIVLASKILTHTDTHPIVVKSALKRLEATMPEHLNPQRRLSVSLQCIRNCVFGRSLMPDSQLISNNRLCFKDIVKKAYNTPSVNTALKKNNDNHYVELSMLLSHMPPTLAYYALTTALSNMTFIEQQILAKGLNELSDANGVFINNAATLMFLKDLLREFDHDCSRADVMPVTAAKHRFEVNYSKAVLNGFRDSNFVNKINDLDLEDMTANALLHEISHDYFDVMQKSHLKQSTISTILEDGKLISNKIQSLNERILVLSATRETDTEYQASLRLLFDLLASYMNRLSEYMIAKAKQTGKD